MWQVVIMYLIVVVAAGFALRHLIRKFRHMHSKTEEKEGCRDCPLKEHCQPGRKSQFQEQEGCRKRT